MQIGAKPADLGKALVGIDRRRAEQGISWLLAISISFWSGLEARTATKTMV